MGKQLLRVFMIAVCLGGTAGHGQTPPPAASAPLTSVAIDPALFRDGAIQRFSGTLGAWTYVCDEVKQLKQRFCSLRSAVKDKAAAVMAELTISTGEDGRPAALMRMAEGDIGGEGVDIVVNARPNPAGAKPAAAAKPVEPYKVYPAACERGVCELIWTLTPAHISALNSGAGLIMRYRARVPNVSALAGGLKPDQPPRQTLDAAIDATGFSAAVEASLKPSAGPLR